MITNNECLILGLLAETPRYGYEIDQTIETRGLREWTEIGFSSIYYLLNKMEKDGLLTSEKISSENRPAKKRYALAESTWPLLKEALLQRLSTPTSNPTGFSIGLAYANLLCPDELIAALSTYHEALTAKTDAVQLKWKNDRAFMPPHVNALFDHSIQAMQAELDWVKKYLDSLKGETNDD